MPHFPNLARRKMNMNDGQIAPGVYIPFARKPGPQPKPTWDPKDVEHVTEVTRAELLAAGVDKIEECDALLLGACGEVPTKLLGILANSGWSFKRCWRYWRCEGPGIPATHAYALWIQCGQTCRAGFHCGGPNPLDYYHGFGAGEYDVDTSEGLKALVDTLKLVRAEGLRLKEALCPNRSSSELTSTAP